MKLIPKKFGKMKYIKGVDEVKKKPAPPVEVKEKPKKQKIVMMPCMSASKKERDTKGQFNTSEKKKVAPKALTAKKVQKYKDVGTQVRY